MGLDMYAYAVNANVLGDKQVDFHVPEIDPDKVEEEAFEERDKRIGMVQLMTWRKFNHLHGWMHRLYQTKGGEGLEFNCDNVRLDLADLRALEVALKIGLPHEPGFFFGGEEINEWDMDKTKEFIALARDAIANGKAVFYSSWW